MPETGCRREKLEGFMWTEDKWTADKLKQYTVGEEPGRESRKTRPAAASVRKERMDDTPWERERSGRKGLTAAALFFAGFGTMLILLALWILYTNFLSAAHQAEFLYVVFLFLIIYSELAVYRRKRGKGLLLTCLGLCGLYACVWVDYRLLHHIGVISGLLVAALIALVSVFMSFKKNSGWMCFLGLLGCCIDLLSLGFYGWSEFFSMLTGIVFMLTLLCVLFPVKKSFWGTTIAIQVLQVVFSYLLTERAYRYQIADEDVFCFIFLSFLTAALAFWKLSGWTERMIRAGEPADRVSDTLLFVAVMSIYAQLISFSIVRLESMESENMAMAMVCIPCVVLFFLMGNRKQRWLYYVFLQAVAYIAYVLLGSEVEGLLCMLVLLMVSKALTVVKELALSEAAVTVLAGVMLLRCGSDAVPAWFLFAAMALSVLAIHKWNSFYEIWIPFSLLAFLYGRFSEEVFLLAVMAISFVGLFLFHRVGRLRGKGIEVVDFCLLLADAVCLLSLPELPSHSAGPIWFVAFVFGLAVVLLILKPKYQALSVLIFLTYMVGIVPAVTVLVKCILLAALALFGLALGFYKRKKSVRTFCLFLSVGACCWLLFWDLPGYEPAQKVFLLLGTGIVMLLTTGSYFLLDRKFRELT